MATKSAKDMTFEEKIIKNCKVRQRNLMRPAKIAFDKPDTGVTIEKRGAYFLIKDSADITMKYLAHLAYSSYSDPTKDLKGKFTEAEIIGFVGRSKKEPHTKQLLHIILTDIGSAQYQNAVAVKPIPPTETSSSADHDYTVKDDEDVYGDYDLEDGNEEEQPVNVDVETDIDVDDASAVINKLVEVFQAR